MKENFLLKKEHQDIFTALTNEEAGELIKGIFNYVCTGESGLTGTLNAVFVPIKKVIDENEEKYKKICERNKVNGQNGGRKKSTDDTDLLGEIDEEPNETQNNPVGCFGKNTHISYITNHKSYNHNSYIINQVINYLNNKLSSNYKTNSKNNIRHINARLNEGYSLDDFIAVIDKKYDEWYGTEMQKYLRPETLFGSKFEGYVNQLEYKRKITTKDLDVDLTDFMEVK